MIGRRDFITLVNVDPACADAVRKLQNDMQRFDDLVRWLKDLMDAGFEAERLLSEGETAEGLGFGRAFGDGSHHVSMNTRRSNSCTAFAAPAASFNPPQRALKRVVVLHRRGVVLALGPRAKREGAAHAMLEDAFRKYPHAMRVGVAACRAHP